MKTVVNLTKENRKFIEDLLNETKEDFGRAFHELAKSDSIKGKRKLVSHWLQLSELLHLKYDDIEEEGGKI